MSPYLTISNLLHVRLKLYAVPQNLTIHGMEVFVLQDFELISPHDKSRRTITRPMTQRKLMWKWDGDAVKLGKGEEWDIEKWTR
jgi:hypothetical protein